MKKLHQVKIQILTINNKIKQIPADTNSIAFLKPPPTVNILVVSQNIDQFALLLQIMALNITSQVEGEENENITIENWIKNIFKELSSEIQNKITKEFNNINIYNINDINNSLNNDDNIMQFIENL